MKVRASAAADSFRRKAALEEHLEKAKKRVAELKSSGRRSQHRPAQKKAHERAAREKVERVQAALRNQRETGCQPRGPQEGGTAPRPAPPPPTLTPARCK